MRLPASDEELMALAARDDLAAFAALFDRHQPRVYAFHCRFLGDRTAAEDAAQETFRRMWQYRARFDAGKPFRTWLYTIARHAALDELRAARTKDASLNSTIGSGLNADLADGAPTPHAAYESSDLRRLVQRALTALPEEQRLSLVLREYERMSHREVAAVLGCSEGNARVIAHRARAALRGLLRPLLESEEVHA